MASVDSSRMANAIRALAMDAVEKAKSGHPGLPMGAADVATVLFTKFLKYDAADPHWPDRDRFILSAGHGSMLLYALLYLTGYKEMTLDQIFDDIGIAQLRWDVRELAENVLGRHFHLGNLDFMAIYDGDRLVFLHLGHGRRHQHEGHRRQSGEFGDILNHQHRIPIQGSWHRAASLPRW